ncbi:glycosyltransferase family 2 protein [Shouchella clausii]|uniref:Glycosyl transferase n=1 Tax=Shouchella clausii TaxID=79880 RepID=A0A268RXG6_SHOCL|nr:glycosyltransferase family 2 protein [Shouchella clausii]PAD43148.1 glycosyl transferase [Bacillus sp. 7520-S]MBU8596691.1 glycosyltransferase family 2 protein [Shouchella clausii]MCY1106035.1 glycosyltransferase family 2 protein [Shouchella clausii]MEB5478614.1 glycosyltransferase family 2 protein [Shouchella clausii]MED4160466.1 glycosyltransferase family 2 protein [Shouchella clausii]
MGEQTAQRTPFFSVLLVLRNEEAYIGRLLEQVLNQQRNGFEIELIVVDGHSTDNTREIVRSYQQKHPIIKLVDNPKQTLPVGWNLAIKEASGEYVLRIDGHTSIPDDFLLRYAKVIRKQPDADVVGGIIESKGEGTQGCINEYVYSHPFGVGNSKFRTLASDQVWEGFVDTVPYGAYKRSVFQEVGYFNEQLKRNEDLEFHKRMRTAGKTFFLSTTICSTYYVRSTIGGLIDKSLGDGMWTIVANRVTPGSLGNRHKAPLFAFIAGLALLAASFFHPGFALFFALCVTAYIGASAYASTGFAKKKGWKWLLPCMWTFFCLHFFRGYGSFKAFFTKAYWTAGR